MKSFILAERAEDFQKKLDSLFLKIFRPVSRVFLIQLYPQQHCLHRLWFQKYLRHLSFPL